MLRRRSSVLNPQSSDLCFFRERGEGRCMPITNFVGLPDFLSTESATTPAMTAPTKPTPMTTTISRPINRCSLTNAFNRLNSWS